MTTVPTAILDALQEHIDRTEADLRHQYRDNTDACNAIRLGKHLGMLQEWVLIQRGNDHSIDPSKT